MFLKEQSVHKINCCWSFTNFPNDTFLISVFRLQDRSLPFKCDQKKKTSQLYALFIQFQLNVDCSLTSLLVIYAASLTASDPTSVESTHQKQWEPLFIFSHYLTPNEAYTCIYFKKSCWILHILNFAIIYAINLASFRIENNYSRWDI